MNLLKYVSFTAGALVLFAGSFLVFASLSGTPMHEVALVGGLFPEPGDAIPTSVEPGLAGELERDERPERQVVEEATLPLQSFLVPSPFSIEELQALQSQLQSRLDAVQLEANELAGRAAELEDRERQLEDRWEELVKIRTALIEHDLELEQREDELHRDERVSSERESASWTSMARIFENGKAKDLSDNLILFPPDDAARILRSLADDRASELINEIPREKYLEYAEAYRKAGLKDAAANR